MGAQHDSDESKVRTRSFRPDFFFLRRFQRPVRNGPIEPEHKRLRNQIEFECAHHHTASIALASARRACRTSSDQNPIFPRRDFIFTSVVRCVTRTHHSSNMASTLMCAHCASRHCSLMPLSVSCMCACARRVCARRALCFPLAASAETRVCEILFCAHASRTCRAQCFITHTARARRSFDFPA